MAEYALVAGVICLAVFATIGLLSGRVESAIRAVGTFLS
jgi:Flp pilus assembly pilin Flp